MTSRDPRDGAVAFGAGGSEPYATVLAAPLGGRLALRRVGSWDALESGAGVPGALEYDVGGWLAPATAVDLAVLAEVRGPLLDVGCGPGRMVHAAEELAMPCLGIDVSTDATAMAAATGTPVLRRSIFERLPLEGQWRTVLLMDGNVGIGGDPHALLARCAILLAPDGVVVVEVDADPALLDCDVFTAVDSSGRESAAFPWARVGADALTRIAASVGLVAGHSWRSAGRSFVVLRRVTG